jgi:hypothetical protein
MTGLFFVVVVVFENFAQASLKPQPFRSLPPAWLGPQIYTTINGLFVQMGSQYFSPTLVSNYNPLGFLTPEPLELQACAQSYSFSPLSILFSLEGSHRVKPTVKERGYRFQLLEGGVFT